MRYVVGLGNPGQKYVRTRHNLGWMVVEEIAARLGVRDEREKWGGIRTRVGDLTLFKPLTFMNNSGEAVSRLVADNYVSEQDLLIVMDDLDLVLGSVRLRPDGSSGGHRGLQSVIDRLGTDHLPRLRLGIGPCPPEAEPRHFVLDHFAEDELPVVQQMLRRSVRAVLCWRDEGMQAAMSRHNGRVNAVVEE